MRFSSTLRKAYPRCDPRANGERGTALLLANEFVEEFSGSEPEKPGAPDNKSLELPGYRQNKCVRSAFARYRLRISGSLRLGPGQRAGQRDAVQFLPRKKRLQAAHGSSPQDGERWTGRNNRHLLQNEKILILFRVLQPTGNQRRRQGTENNGGMPGS